ncbi:3'-5' exoribonuclease YhaM family protein [Desulfolithobacter sp.]
MKEIFIDQLQEGQQVHDVFLVSRKTLAETKAGKPYLSLTLMDRTGDIEGRVWDNATRYDAQAEVGTFIRLHATAKSYQGRLQLGITSLEQVDADTVQLEDFIPASPRDPEEMQAELRRIIALVQDAHLQPLLAAMFRGETLKQFVRAPAAKKMHHAYIGGLIEHTLSVTGMAMRTADHYPALNRDLLIAGALLHDIAKIREFEFTSVPFEYTDSGRLLGHLVLGSEMVRQQAAAIEDFPADLLDQLLHLILSHHGRHEFGAPVLPMTPEALILHHLDDMDAKMNYIDGLRASMEEGLHWSDYQRPLERFLYLQGTDTPPEPPRPALESPGRPAARSRREKKKPAPDFKQPTLF